MKPTLVDTDILSGFLRGNSEIEKSVSRYLSLYESLNISIITYYEDLNGLLYKDAHKQLEKFSTFAAENNTLTLSTIAAEKAAKIFADLRKRGQPIGHTDCLIAGIALTNGLQIANNNAAHFNRIEGLEIANWN